MATLETKYNLGERVWLIKSSFVGRLVHCDLCKREGTVKIGNESFTCPKCEGKSRHIQHVGNLYTPWTEGKIGQIRVEVNDPQQTDAKDTIVYMLDVTGIGSGNLWPEKDLFRSRREAEEACAELNGSKVFEDDPE